MDLHPPGAGYGVFALKDFVAGQPILMCVGTYGNTPQTQEQERYSYDVQYQTGLYLQCHQNTETNLIKYVNSTGGRGNANVTVIEHGPLLMLEAKNHIWRFDELLLDYEF